MKINIMRPLQKGRSDALSLGKCGKVAGKSNVPGDEGVAATLFRRGFIITFLLAFVSSGLSQGTIISVSGPPDTTSQYSPQLTPGKMTGISWITSSPFSDVNIYLNLNADPGATAMAYLTTSIGPGTTTSDEVASAIFNFPSTSSLVPVLSGLYLPSGTYYLIIVGMTVGENGSGIWQGTPTPTLFANPSVTANHEYLYPYSASGYPPATEFGYSTALVPHFEFSIIGAPVPEPAMNVLLELGLACFGLYRLRQSK
ncbi:MAG: hypothetical protein WDM76_15795 [Limisphaerales bacterium]